MHFNQKQKDKITDFTKKEKKNNNLGGQSSRTLTADV
jgi:hypothetical protein